MFLVSFPEAENNPLIDAPAGTFKLLLHLNLILILACRADFKCSQKTNSPDTTGKRKEGTFRTNSYYKKSNMKSLDLDLVCPLANQCSHISSLTRLNKLCSSFVTEQPNSSCTFIDHHIHLKRFILSTTQQKPYWSDFLFSKCKCKYVWECSSQWMTTLVRVLNVRHRCGISLRHQQSCTAM